MTINLHRWLAVVMLAVLGAVAMPAAAQDDHAADPAAHAADDSHSGDDHGGSHAGGGKNVIPTVKEGMMTGIMTLLVFVAVLFVLGTQVWPKIQGSLTERENKIREEIQAAELARQQARDALEEYERSLAQARAEAQEMLDNTRAQQAEMAAELRTKADAQLTDLREKAQRDIEAAKRAALNEIYAEAASLATLAAGKILQREINPADQQRLVDESLAELSASRN